ncbi:lactaldehyde reductase [Caviibacterium pharyngocola]|uniref:Lactaldehyde reductase n=1 Tax=Caviibacterium pharyngocola TaxID=28159 RepID=A0A2M8RWF5_9PAST|nr:lactaldehyde reductase [Caviibacterium pharyngocola]PJG83228.1 lactaldehyde reductase [Caviibacterium pharyngocola]
MANRMILNETAYHGKGAISHIVPEIQRRGFKKVLVVTDSDLVKFNVAQKVTALFDQAGIAYQVFDKVKANPSVDIIKLGVEQFKQCQADCLVAIGGGSPIDSAKAIGIIINNPEFGDVLSLEGVAPTKRKCVPIIAVATTAGTAAEVTINYVITDEEKKRKFVCVDVNDIPVVAIVDPDMMSSMPKGLTAATGMDALTHAIEGYITKAAWELTDALHLKAIELISRSLRAAVENDPKGREDMALGQYVAGMGFSNVGLGVVHSMAHPLSAYYDTPHGIANAVLLPYVMEFNKDYTGEKYREIAKAMGVKNADEMSQAEYRRAAIDAVKCLAKGVGIPEKLSQIGVKEADLSALSVDAFNDVCTGGNSRDCSAEEILEVYKTAF